MNGAQAALEDDWLRTNTFLCPRGVGRITPAFCEELRNRPPFQPTGPRMNYRPPACEGCEGVGAMEENVEETKTCRRCGRTLPIEEFSKNRMSRDGYLHRCKDCVNALSEAGRAGPSSRVIRKETGVLIDFSVCPEVLRAIAERAAEELRTIESQIVWELKKKENRGRRRSSAR